jgi:predicted O-linked N-acetylglucosamine transferase (SPINDLY family)
LGAIDVRITDALADPPGISDQYSVERLVRLPGSYFCYRPMPNSPAVGALPAASAGFITFGCFNNFPKLSTDFLDTTAQVLAAVPGSRLILKSRQLSNPEISDWVLGRFRQAGIELERIRLLGWAPSTTDHLAVYGAIDIALDSFPYNGATTTCESLWMGVPVVTVAGDRHAGRVGSSLLSAVGLEELIAHDVNHYIAKAKDLAGNLEKLARLRRDLRQRMQQSPVMDEAGFTRGLEQSYIQIWREYLDSRTTPTTADGRPVAELLADARRARAEGELTTASAVCEAILQSDPAHLEALTLRWDLAYDSGTPGAAIDWINRAISANNGARFHYMLGCVLQSQGKIEAAIASFQQSLALDAGSAKTHNNIGCLLEMAGNFPGAEQHYREAVRLDPAVAPAQYNLGNLYRQAGESELALEYIARALSIEPGRTDWICNLGDLRMRKGELDLAFELFNSALKIDSKFEPARVAMAESLLRSGRLPEAQEALAAAIQLAPGRADVASMLLAANLCDDRIEPKMLFEQHQAWSDRHATGVVRWSSTRRHRQGTDCLNVGYLVADLAQPLFASHLEPVLSAHDRKRFNIFCYATIGLDGEVARRAGNERTHWRDISQLQDPEAVMRIRADGIDILVDLVGHGPGGRLPLLARKPAPIQVSWIGYPASTGVAAVDYRLTDSIADPEGRTDRYYCERLVRLPGTYLCYQPDSGNPEITPPPQQEENRIVYGCFNPLLDITPRVIELWADILQRQAHSRLRVVSQGLSNQIARSTLLEKFSLHGIAQDRIELSAPQQSPGSRLDQYQQVDVVLDTSPVSGATNTCDSLWMGVPVVTLAGSQFASRTAASVLASLELGDYIATSPVHYVETAVAAGSDTDRRYKLRAGLRARMRNSELTNAGHFVAGLEAAYLQMHA